MMKIRALNGFTLIEIIISLAVLAIGVVALLSLFPVGFDSAARSADLTKATVFAQQKMEDIKRTGYPVAAVATPTPFSDTRFTYTIAVLALSPPGNLQQVTLTVSWTYRGRSYNETFITYIPKYTP